MFRIHPRFFLMSTALTVTINLLAHTPAVPLPTPISTTNTQSHSHSHSEKHWHISPFTSIRPFFLSSPKPSATITPAVVTVSLPPSTPSVIPPVTPPAPIITSPALNSRRVTLLARLIQAEAGNQSFLTQLDVGAVVLNRMHAIGFPHHLLSVILQPGQFSSVSDGAFAQATPSPRALRAAVNALTGWDPTHGALYFFNPSLPHNGWMNSLQACMSQGAMLFCPAPS